MFGKILGAGLGAKAAEHTRGIGGPMGAVIGAAAPVLLRRLSIPAMVAIAAGGYAYKKYSEKKEAREAAETTPPVTSVAPATAPAAA